jgi:hypothetical protein
MSPRVKGKEVEATKPEPAKKEEPKQNPFEKAIAEKRASQLNPFEKMMAEKKATQQNSLTK